MAISDQLTLLNNTKQAIKTSINNKGGSVTDSTPFADYSTAIDNLPSGGDNSTLIDLIERDITSINIPSGTTRIGNYAFSSCTGLTSISIPSSVTSIGDSAFDGCSSLASVTIPDSVTSIGNYGFQSCSKLTRVTISGNVTSIGDGTFSNCQALASVNIPDSVTTIGVDAFNGCTSLTSVTIPDSVTSIGEYAFQSVGLTSVIIPNSLTSLGNGAFYYCSSLTSVTVGNGITNDGMGQVIFSYNRNLSSVILTDGLTSIGVSMFDSCTSLTSINIPSSVTEIKDMAFKGCTAMTSVIVNATTPPTLGSDVFNNTNNCPIYVPSESVDTYKAASRWSDYASRIYPIQQVATVDGNPVYNYEIGNKNATTVLDVELEKMPAGTSVEFSEGLTNITAGKINYQQVTLPSTFTGFGDSDMIGSSVTTITSNAVTPPGAFRNRLGGSGLTAIYVPASAVDAYKANATWSSFASIIQAIPAE